MTAGKTSILFLSYDGLTDPLGQSQVLPYLCGLSKEGFQITIISFEKPDRFVRENGHIKELCNQYQLEWYPLPYHKSPPVLSTLYDIFQLRKLAMRLHVQKQFAVVHCRSYIVSLVGLMLKNKLGIKFIFDMRGFWADERVEGGLWNLRNPIFKWIYDFFKRKEKQLIKNADCIISLTENARREILQWKLSDNIKVIPCCVDVDHFDPAKFDETKKRLLRDELGIGQDDFVLLYLGSLGTWYLADQMINFFDELKKTKPTAKFLIVTPDKLELSDVKHGADIIVRRASRDLVPLFISLADVSLIFYKPGFSKKATSPVKMAESLAMGKPVIVNAEWGDVSFYKKILQGLLVTSPDDYGNTIAAISQSQNSQAIRAGAIENFSLSRGIALYRQVYQDVL